MTVTFLVAVNLDDLTSLPDVAADIEDDLTTTGHDVVSVKPWARPTQQMPPDALAAAQSLVQPQQPTTQQQIEPTQ